MSTLQLMEHHPGAGEKCVEEGSVCTDCHRLTATPAAHPCAAWCLAGTKGLGVTCSDSRAGEELAVKVKLGLGRG